MEMILGLIFVTSWVMVAPKVIADAITTMRASKAGAWDTIDKERDRRERRAQSRRQAVSKAWQATRARRHKKAGGNGNYRPGLRAYLGDVYHGFWEDALEKRAARRAGRPPNRYDRAVAAKVQRRRDKSGMVGRVARALIDPVGERRQPADVVPPTTDGRDGGDAGGLTQPVDPWAPAGGGDEPTADLTEGMRYACPVCGETLTEKGDGWTHPVGSTCTAVATDAPARPASPPARAAAPAPAGSRSDRQVSDELLTAARQALAKHDPKGTRGLLFMDAATDAVLDAYPDADPGEVQRAVNRADNEPPCPECGQRAWSNPPCEHRKTYEERVRRNAREALELLHPHVPAGQATSGREPGATTDNTSTSNGGTDMTMKPGRTSPYPSLLADVRVGTNLGRELAGIGTGHHYSSEGPAMTNGTADLLTYNEAVTQHEEALAKLLEQRAQALAFQQHLTAATAAVEAMDGNRDGLVQSLAPLAEGMEGSRFGADATEGSAEAVGTLTAGTIGAVQENLEAAVDQNNRWLAELAAAIEGVQASLQHVKATYGEAAATVQETGVQGAALEER